MSRIARTVGAFVCVAASMLGSSIPAHADALTTSPSSAQATDVFTVDYALHLLGLPGGDATPPSIQYELQTVMSSASSSSALAHSLQTQYDDTANDIAHKLGS